jgi:hypothetical protein
MLLQIKAGVAAKTIGTQEDCLEGQDGDDVRCTVQRSDGSTYVYAAHGEFYGGNEEYIVIRYETTVRHPVKGMGGYGNGLVVLKHAL